MSQKCPIRRSSRTFLPGLALGAFVLAAPSAVLAEGEAADVEGLLDTAVVSAPSKTAETATVAPATSIVISGDDLRRYGIRSVDEAINFLAFGMVAEKRFQTAEIGSRGVLLNNDFGGHVLLMVDGHVLNEQWGATAYFDRGTLIPFEMIDHIEIVLGPGSVLYGSNAMLGIVHIVTKRAKDFDGAHIVVESEIPTTMRIAGGVGHEFQLGSTPGEVVVELEAYEQKGPTFDFGPQDLGEDIATGETRHFDPNPNDRIYPAGTWGGKGDDAYYTHAQAAYLRLRLGNVEMGARAAIYDRTDPTDGGNFDDPTSHEVDRWLHLDLKHTVWATPAVQLSTRLYGDVYDYRQDWTSDGAEDCLPGQDQGCLWVLHGAAQWTGLEPQLTFDWFEDGQVATLIGIDGRLKRVDSQVDFFDNVTGESPGSVGAYDQVEKALAAYVQQTVWATNWLALNAGARVDIDERFGSHGSPRAAVAVLPWQGGTIKGIYSEAFRAPTAFDIYYYDPTSQLPGGDLKPETVRSLEGTFEQHFGAQSVRVGAFQSWWNDMLLLQDISNEELLAAQASGELEEDLEWGTRVQNVSSINSVGFDAGYQGSTVSGRLRYGASLTEAFARRKLSDGTTTVLNVAPQVFGNAHISYDLSRGLPTLALVGRFVTARPVDELEGTRFANPAVELRATVSGPTPLLGLSYRLTANWLSDDRGPYIVHTGTRSDGSLELQPKDTFRIGVGFQYDFAL